MSFLDLPDDASATALPPMAADVEAMGYLPNYSRLFALRPEVYEAWDALNGAVKRSMDPRRYELATLAAARQLSSSYCQLAHGQVLLQQGMAARDLEAVASDRHAPGIAALGVLDATDLAVMDLAAQVAADATAVTQADIDRLTAVGLSAQDVLDVVLAASARSFFSKTLDATGTTPDAAFRTTLPASLRAALTTGRPVDH